jgi:hypothetical protein
MLPLEQRCPVSFLHYFAETLRWSWHFPWQELLVEKQVDWLKMFLIDALEQGFHHSLVSYLTRLSGAWMLRLVHLWNVSAWGIQLLQEGFS